MYYLLIYFVHVKYILSHYVICIHNFYYSLNIIGYIVYGENMYRKADFQALKTKPILSPKCIILMSKTYS